MACVGIGTEKRERNGGERGTKLKEEMMWGGSPSVCRLQSLCVSFHRYVQHSSRLISVEAVGVDIRAHVRACDVFVSVGVIFQSSRRAEFLTPMPKAVWYLAAL